MILKITITTNKKGIGCNASVDGADAFSSVEANTFAIGALEIAKASLLAHRWGVNVGNLKPESLVDPPVEEGAEP